MGKKSKTRPSSNTPKNQKKQPLNSMIKVLKPKVYITDFTNFKNLVQQLTGNNTNSNNNNISFVSSPPDPLQCHEVVPKCMQQVEGHGGYQESDIELSFDQYYSSCFSSSLEGSPDLGFSDYNSCGYSVDGSLGCHDKSDFGWQYGDLESLLMGMDSVSSSDNYVECYNYDQLIQHEQVCVEDYGYVSSLM